MYLHVVIMADILSPCLSAYRIESMWTVLLPSTWTGGLRNEEKEAGKRSRQNDPDRTSGAKDQQKEVSGTYLGIRHHGCQAHVHSSLYDFMPHGSPTMVLTLSVYKVQALPKGHVHKLNSQVLATLVN